MPCPERHRRGKNAASLHPGVWRARLYQVPFHRQWLQSFGLERVTLHL